MTSVVLKTLSLVKILREFTRVAVAGMTLDFVRQKTIEKQIMWVNIQHSRFRFANNSLLLKNNDNLRDCRYQGIGNTTTSKPIALRLSG